MSEDNLYILRELIKGAKMGIEALDLIHDKANEKDFKKVITDLLRDYKDYSRKLDKFYEANCDDEVVDNNPISKVMTWYGLQFRTIMDDSDSKLSELTLQGLNMGIIEGRKFLNTKKIDKKVLGLLNEYIDMQEEYVEKVKNYL